jgi:hypothetical protein
MLDRIPVASTGNVAGGGISEELALMPLPGPGSQGGVSHAGGAGGAEARQARELRERPQEYLEMIDRRLGNRPLPDLGKLPPTGTQRGFSPAGELRLPAVVGTTSWDWVSGWIRREKELPPRDAVRVEELINTASLPAAAEADGLGVTVETMVTPWNRDSRLVAVEWSAGDAPLGGLEIRSIAASPQRVLGSFRAASEQSLPRSLPADRKTLVMIEVLKGDPDASPQRIEIRHDGRPPLEMVVPDPPATPSAGMRHAVLMAGFGLWLRDEGVGAEPLAQLVEAAATQDSDPVRRAARRVVGEALALADTGR